MPAAGAHLHLVTDADRIVTRLTLDNIVSDADHVVATHTGPECCQPPWDRRSVHATLPPVFGAFYSVSDLGAHWRGKDSRNCGLVQRIVRSHNVVRIAHDVI